MMQAYVRTMWWQIEKDLLRELRMPRTWPAMLLLGCILTWFATMQVIVPPEYRHYASAGLFWLIVFLAGSMPLERSFASEREHGCWQTLTLYPPSPSNLFLAKLISNFIAVNCLASILAVTFTVFAEATLFNRPGYFIAVVLLGNLGFVTAGTIVSGLTVGCSHKNYLLALLLLPLAAPLLIAASEATRLLLVHSTDPGLWRWVHLLAAFDVAFVVAGILLFEFVIEE